MLINDYSVGSVFVFYVFVSFVYFNILTIFSSIFVSAPRENFLDVLIILLENFKQLCFALILGRRKPLLASYTEK